MQNAKNYRKYTLLYPVWGFFGCAFSWVHFQFFQKYFWVLFSLFFELWGFFKFCCLTFNISLWTLKCSCWCFNYCCFLWIWILWPSGFILMNSPWAVCKPWTYKQNHSCHLGGVFAYWKNRFSRTINLFSACSILFGFKWENGIVI